MAALPLALHPWGASLRAPRRVADAAQIVQVRTPPQAARTRAPASPCSSLCQPHARLTLCAACVQRWHEAASTSATSSSRADFLVSKLPAHSRPLHVLPRAPTPAKPSSCASLLSRMAGRREFAHRPLAHRPLAHREGTRRRQPCLRQALQASPPSSQCPRPARRSTRNQQSHRGPRAWGWRRRRPAEAGCTRFRRGAPTAVARRVCLWARLHRPRK